MLTWEIISRTCASGPHGLAPDENPGEADAQAVANSGNDLPVILKRKFGEGIVVLVGDSDFAMNKNMELRRRQPIEGMHENSDFLAMVHRLAERGR